eukprot:GHRQ01025854.1.p1 GENE.GHRQ01025854.1~~GHRQ01025854.1.p1  ORF type:complete len:144 (-),score=15.17 GHRQ01025854.1:187-618(-)
MFHTLSWDICCYIQSSSRQPITAYSAQFDSKKPEPFTCQLLLVTKFFQSPPAGAAGLALALWRAGTLQQRPEWLDAAQQLVATALSSVARSPQYYVQESLLDGAQHSVLLVLLHCTACNNRECSVRGAVHTAMLARQSGSMPS